MALDIAKNDSNPLAVRLLSEAVSVETTSRDAYRSSQLGLTLVLPLDFIDLIDDDAARAIARAAQRAGIDHYHEYVAQQLAPAADGWRDRLAELEDWGDGASLAGEWAVINERVHELRTLFQRAVTPADRADVGRRCRELMIAAASATFRPAMVPDGEEPPKESDAKAKCKLILEYVGSNSVDVRLSKLIDKAWDLAVGLLHHTEPARPATYAAAQSAVLVVRTLAVIEGELLRDDR